MLHERVARAARAQHLPELDALELARLEVVLEARHHVRDGVVLFRGIAHEEGSCLRDGRVVGDPPVLAQPRRDGLGLLARPERREVPPGPADRRGRGPRQDRGAPFRGFRGRRRRLFAPALDELLVHGFQDDVIDLVGLHAPHERGELFHGDRVVPVDVDDAPDRPELLERHFQF